jgi:Tfp pilus assembly protein PilW
MYIKLPHKSTRAFTLVELVIAFAVFMVAGAAVMSFFMFGLRSFATLYNYAALDAQNRNAMDTMTREIRSAVGVLNYTTNPASLMLRNSDNNTVIYTFYPPPARQLTRDVWETKEHRVLLENCDLLQFQLYKRNPLTNEFDAFPVSTSDWSNTVKLVELTWKTSVNICPTIVTNSEDVQTARIVIRKASTTD